MRPPVHLLSTRTPANSRMRGSMRHIQKGIRWLLGQSHPFSSRPEEGPTPNLSGLPRDVAFYESLRILLGEGVLNALGFPGMAQTLSQEAAAFSDFLDLALPWSAGAVLPAMRHIGVSRSHTEKCATTRTA